MLQLVSLSLALLSGSVVHSFPTADKLGLLRPSESQIHDALIKLRTKRLMIDPNGVPIDVTEQHQFQPPDFSAGDQRGPCPGLNALANHGYLPHNGIASSADIIVGVNEVFGMGIDLGTVLSLMGTVWTGNPLSLNPKFSIGGESSAVNNIGENLLGLGLLGTPRGLAGSHNFIEADASLTRDDLYVTGDATALDINLFWETYEAASGNIITFDDIGDQAAKRFAYSKASNPYFYYGPLTGMVVRNAAYLFASRLLGNHSIENPEGQLTKEVFKSFWGIYDDASAPSGVAYRPGWERIPNNWYKIPADYGLISLNLDLLSLFEKHPELMSIGGNTGSVDSFTGIDFSDLIGGITNTGTLLEGNNLICFVLEVVKTFAPNTLSSIFKTLERPLQILSTALVAPLIDLSCPVYADIEAGGSDILNNLFSQFPGASKANSAL